MVINYAGLLKFIFIFVITPLAFLYFALYPEIGQSPYLLLHFAYFLCLVMIFYFGINIDFRPESKTLVIIGIMTIALTNVLIAFNVYVEHSESWLYFIIPMALLSRVLIFYAFSLEDTYKKQDYSNMS